MIIKKYLCILLAFFAIVGCDTLEDTYSEYAGDGTIRYQGKCTDVTVTSGWRKLNVTWKNNIDPVITNVKISWESDSDAGSVLVPRGTTSCSVNVEGDGNYEISVYSVDKDGNSSLPCTAFGRPYAPEHEAVLSFTRLISKHYFYNNHLVLFFSSWDRHVESAVLTYSVIGGEERVLDLDSTIIQGKFLLIGEKGDLGFNDKIDLSKPIVLKRTGKIDGCDDLITFAPYNLLDNKLYTTDFKQLIETQYNLTGMYPAEFVTELTSLEIDYSINSFEDILNFPNLTKLILGKNRYLFNDPTYLTKYSADSKLTEIDRSIFALDVANKISGLTVDLYNQHFSATVLKNSLGFISSFANPKIPTDLVWLNPKASPSTTWSIICNPTFSEANVNFLIDGDEISTYWQPYDSRTQRTYNIMIDMKEVKNIGGVKIVQKKSSTTEKLDPYRLPQIMEVTVSEDNFTWSNATYMTKNIIGATNGETVIIKFNSEAQNVRYIRFTLSDQLIKDISMFGITLAEISVFAQQ